MELSERIFYICMYNSVVQIYCVPFFLVLNMQEEIFLFVEIFYSGDRHRLLCRHYLHLSIIFHLCV